MMINSAVFGMFLIVLATGYELAVRHCWTETLAISGRLRNPEVRAQWFASERPRVVALITASRVVIAVLATVGVMMVLRAAIAAVLN